jgi:hypothetical protein
MLAARVVARALITEPSGPLGTPSARGDESPEERRAATGA